MITLFLSLVLGSISGVVYAQDENHPQAGEITKAMIQMMDRSTERDELSRFVIVEVPGTDNFIQYASIGPEQYIFDIPLVSLSNEQFEQVRPFLESKGVSLIYFGDDNETSKSDLSNYAFQKFFENEQVEQGIALGLDFLAGLLGYRGRDLVVTRGWE